MSKKNLVCNVDDSFLVLIDIQTDLTSAMPVKVLARLQRYFNFMLKAAELLGVPVIATDQYPIISMNQRGQVFIVFVIGIT